MNLEYVNIKYIIYYSIFYIMRLEFFIIGITAFFIYNAYADGKYTKMFLSQMEIISLQHHTFQKIYNRTFVAYSLNANFWSLRPIQSAE